MTIFSSSVLLDTTFSRLVFFVTVTCPCSSTTKCHVNLFVYNNNNNNNNTHLCLDSTLQFSRRLGHFCPHNPRGRRLAVAAFLDFTFAFNPRDLYYRGYKKKYIYIK